MARPKIEINVKRCERLKQIIEETGVKQNELAFNTGISQQAISSMVQKKANVTETTAEIIVKMFPQYSFEWLMGYTDYKNNTEKLCAVISKAQNEGDLLLSGLSAFAQLCDYHIKLSSPAHGSHNVEDVLKMVTEGYTLTHDGASIQLSLEEMNAFENEVCDFVELKLKHLFKQRGANGNG